MPLTPDLISAIPKTRCHCTSTTCSDYRNLLLSKALERVSDRPAAITDRRSAAAFLYWVAGQMALELDAAVAEGGSDGWS
jgi:hypothetical protein